MSSLGNCIIDPILVCVSEFQQISAEFLCTQEPQNSSPESLLRLLFRHPLQYLANRVICPGTLFPRQMPILIQFTSNLR